METLFPLQPVLPSGFSYAGNFITPSEESALLDAISGINLHTFLFQGFEAKRKVASFGYDYSFEQKVLSEGKPIPQVFQPLIQKVATALHLPEREFAEVLITMYPPGAVINWHRDAFPFELIAGVSLASDCVFRLRPHEKQKQTRAGIISFPVRRRSLYTMQGEARLAWQHSTAPVKTTRYSITLRTLTNPAARIR